MSQIPWDSVSPPRAESCAVRRCAPIALGATLTYRIHDIDMREPLFEWLEATCGKVRIIEEKTIGRSRADAFMVTPEGLVGIEIKSDADTYERLASQTKNYDRYFDANMVVVGSSHSRVADHVPAWWGIVMAELDGHGGMAFAVARPWQPNRKVSRRRKLSLLWRPELNNILAANGMHRYAAKSKDFVAKKILETVDPATLDRQICDELFERDYTTIADELDEWRAAHAR